MKDNVRRYKKDEQGKAVAPKNYVVVKTRKISRNYTWIAGLVAVILIAVIYLFVKNSSERLEEKNAALDKQIVALQTQLAEQDTRKEELDKKSIYITTKQFVEEFAREKLGLVFPDEVIFRPNED